MTKRTQYSFSVQFKDGGEWNRSEIGSPNLSRVVNHMAEAAEQNAKAGFFPAFRLIKIDPTKDISDALQV
jgi:hypothetical protein